MVRAPNSFSTVGNVNFNFFQSDDQSTSNAIFSALAYATIAEIHFEISSQTNCISLLHIRILQKCAKKRDRN